MASKTIKFRFDGGVEHGKTLITHLGRPATSDEASKAGMLYAMTDRGKVGAAFEGLSQADIELLQKESWEAAEARGHVFQAHRYRVANRQETDLEILITMKHEARE